VKHPRLSTPRAFKQDGGSQAFLAYYATLTERAGYAVQPSGAICGEVVQFLVRDGAFDEAVEFADIALEKWPPASPAMLNDIGYAFMRRNRFDDAQRYLERNIELYPDVANGYDSLGECHERAGNLETARESYERALELGQESGDRLVSLYQRRIAKIDEMIAERTATTP